MDNNKVSLLSVFYIVSSAASAVVISNLNINHSVTGRKFDHAVKHGSRNGLFLVKLGWFVDSVKRNGKIRICFSYHTSLLCYVLFQNEGFAAFDLLELRCLFNTKIRTLLSYYLLRLRYLMLPVVACLVSGSRNISL